MDLAREGEEPAPRHFVNPEVLWASEETAPYEEGCLSVPEIYDEVERPARVKIEVPNYKGEAIVETARASTPLHPPNGTLNGLLFIDHPSRLKRDGAVAKVKKAKAAESQLCAKPGGRPERASSLTAESQPRCQPCGHRGHHEGAAELVPAVADGRLAQVFGGVVADRAGLLAPRAADDRRGGAGVRVLGQGRGPRPGAADQAHSQQRAAACGHVQLRVRRALWGLAAECGLKISILAD